MVKYIPPDKPDPWWRVELPAVLICMAIFFRSHVFFRLIACDSHGITNSWKRKRSN